MVLLPNTEAAAAMRAAERLRTAVESARIQLPGRPQPVLITVSLGVASFPDPCPDVRALLHMADLAVYKSKRNGRNRASMALGAPEETGNADPDAAGESRLSLLTA